MSINSQELFKTKFINSDLSSFVDVIKKDVENERKTFIVTANPITVIQTRENQSLEAAVVGADYVTPDGVGILVAAKFLKKPLHERITGFDLMMKFLEMANLNAHKIYLYGAHPDVLTKTVEKIKEMFPNIDVCGYRDGYIKGEEIAKVALEIKEKKPDFIFVALGVPKQEVWIHEHIDQFDKGIFIGIGGSFDVISGQIKRAPAIYQKLGIEWLYRMLSQPSRLKRTTFIPKFFVETVKERYRSKIRK